MLKTYQQHLLKICLDMVYNKNMCYELVWVILNVIVYAYIHIRLFLLMTALYYHKTHLFIAK